MRLGIFAKTFAGREPLPVLMAAREAGFETAQFNMACAGLPAMPDAIAPSLTRRIAGASTESGVTIAAVSATYNMIHPDPFVRAQGMRRLGVILAAAKAMGTNLVTLCTGTRDRDDQWRHHRDNDTAEAWRDLLTEMSTAIDLAESHSVDLGIEPELANVVNSAVAAWRLIDELKSPRLRIVLDPANLFEVADAQSRRRIVDHAVDLLGDRIAMAHAKDRDAEGHFAAAGQGVIDFRHFVQALRQVGFDGALVTHGLQAGEALQVASFLRDVVAS